MNKKILISLSVIGAVAAIAIGGTIAYFSDVETSTGNTFTAGAIDLQFKVEGTTLGVFTEVNNTPLFTLGDMKPGDRGEKTVKLAVDNNPACGKVEINLKSDLENTCTEPESAVDPDGTTCGTVGELNDEVNFMIWKDNGAGDFSCDNTMNGTETVLVSGPLTSDKAYSIGELPTTATAGDCYGIAYCFGTWSGTACNGSAVGNKSQSDSFSVDMIITALQKRNQYDTACPVVGDWSTPVSTAKNLILENKTAGWVVINDTKQGTLTYNTVGADFVGSFVAAGLTANTQYSLIYYADQQTRFTNWGGENPGAVIGTFTTDGSGVIVSTAINTNLGMDLPATNDWNKVANPDYCLGHNGFDSYATCTGAKIWLVPTSDYNSATKALTAWNPANYLFETDLINYNDTNI
ncbi:MAG: TasA family protein [Candidatus Nealsonbacteria bacterium]|nr:TasA family protein [Candidatus Nealsonbacteria bacterium]